MLSSLVSSKDSPTPNPSPQKPEEKDPRPLPDLSSSTCEPCSDTLPTRKYTLNNGLYCGECHRDGSRENINPENSCDETKIREGLIPIDGRPVV